MQQKAGKKLVIYLACRLQKISKLRTYSAFFSRSQIKQLKKKLWIRERNACKNWCSFSQPHDISVFCWYLKIFYNRDRFSIKQMAWKLPFKHFNSKFAVLLITDSIKINRPGYKIKMYCRSFWFLTAHHSCKTFLKKSYRKL